MNIKEYVKKDYNFIQIIDDDFEVILCDLGASIFAIKYDNKYMTQTYVDEENFLVLRNFTGKTIGRVGNRIKGNKIVIDGKEYTLLNNEGDNTLHGGLEGINRQRFDYQINKTEEKVDVEFVYLSKDGESGFPGNLNVKVVYSLIKGHKELLINYYAETDQTTPCSLTNHAYYTVGEPSLEKTKLYINSSNYLHCNPVDLIPIEKRPCPDYLSFKKPKEIMKDIDNEVLINSKANGYDHHYYFDEQDINKVKAELIGTQYKMSIYTDFSGMQIYSCNHLSTDPCFDILPIRRKSIAMEPQEDFLTLHLLKPNEKYHHFIKLVFSKK